jgi:hypothetical protein
MHIPKHVLIKNPCKRLKFTTIMSFKTLYIYIISMHFSNKFFIWRCFIVLKKLTLFWHIFWVHSFHFFVWQMYCYYFKSSLWIHNLLKFHPIFLWWFPLKSMKKWIIKKLTMLILSMAFNFTFVCNPKIL